MPRLSFFWGFSGARGGAIQRGGRRVVPDLGSGGGEWAVQVRASPPLVFESFDHMSRITVSYRRDFIHHHFFSELFYASPQLHNNIPTCFESISTPPPPVSTYFRVPTPPAPIPSQPCPIPIDFSPYRTVRKRSSTSMRALPLAARKNLCGRAVHVVSRYSEHLIVVAGSVGTGRNILTRGGLKPAPTSFANRAALALTTASFLAFPPL